MMSKRKPHNQDTGYRAERRNPLCGGHVTIYEASEQGIDTDGARYAIVCSAHATIGHATSMVSARVLMKAPHNFCLDCRTIIEGPSE
jgi:hypothetical protein